MEDVLGAPNAQVDLETLYGTMPLLRRERICESWDLFFAAGSVVVATWCYYEGTHVTQTVNGPQATASTWGAVMFFAIIVALVGVMATRYGIDHCFYQRVVFGYVGLLILAAAAIGTTWGWYAINLQMSGQSTQKVANALGANVTAGWLKPLALAAGFASTFLVYDPIVYAIRSSLFKYTMATGLAAFVAAVVCFILAQILPGKRYLTTDATELAVTAAEAEAAATLAGSGPGRGPRPASGTAALPPAVPPARLGRRLVGPWGLGGENT